LGVNWQQETSPQGGPPFITKKCICFGEEICTDKEEKRRWEKSKNLVRGKKKKKTSAQKGAGLQTGERKLVSPGGKREKLCSRFTKEERRKKGHFPQDNEKKGGGCLNREEGREDRRSTFAEKSEEFFFLHQKKKKVKKRIRECPAEGEG